MAEAQVSALLKGQGNERLFDRDERYPVIDDADEQYEDSLLRAGMILLHLFVEIYDLVDASVDEAEGEVKHLDEHWYFVWVDLWIGLQVPQLPVNP